MLLYSNLASLHFSNKYWITLNFAEIHIFRIYRSHTLLICIWFPWNISDLTLAEVKRSRGEGAARGARQTRAREERDRHESIGKRGRSIGLAEDKKRRICL